MQPLHDIQLQKLDNIPHAAAAPSNLDAVITMRSAQAELQNTKELRARTLAKRLMNYQFHNDLQTLCC